MDSQFEWLLAPRIEAECLGLWKDGQYPSAAREALVIVELAVKKKGKVEDIGLIGKKLIEKLFKGKDIVRLKIPFSDQLQDKAQEYFTGVFGYYRNYAAHDGAKIDARIAARILIIASELLELIEASELTLRQVGDIEGLVKIGEFESPARMIKLLKLLDGYHMPESTYDALFEDLLMQGFEDRHVQATIELGLIEMHSGAETIEWLQLTDLGREVLENNDTRS